MGRGGIFTFVDFSVQYDGLREVEETRTDMLMFARDFDIPRTLRRRPSYLKPQTTADIPPCINLAATRIKAS